MKFKIIYLIIGLLVCSGLAYLNVTTPQCELSRDGEAALSTMSVIVFISFMVSLIFVLKLKQKEKKSAVLFIFMFFITVPVAMTAIMRDTETQRNHWNFEGLITDKFISNNHLSKSLVISDIEYEFIPEEIWNAAIIGVSIKKSVCGNIMLNGKEFNFLK